MANVFLLVRSLPHKYAPRFRNLYGVLPLSRWLILNSSFGILSTRSEGLVNYTGQFHSERVAGHHHEYEYEYE